MTQVKRLLLALTARLREEFLGPCVKTVGRDLAEAVATKLERGFVLAYNHRDYCGMGLRFADGEYIYSVVDDGELCTTAQLKEQRQNIAEMERLAFSSRRSFVSWLSTQSDESLYGRDLVPFVAGNQRLSIKRLESFVMEDVVPDIFDQDICPERSQDEFAAQSSQQYTYWPAGNVPSAISVSMAPPERGSPGMQLHQLAMESPFKDTRRTSLLGVPHTGPIFEILAFSSPCDLATRAWSVFGDKCCLDSRILEGGFAAQVAFGEIDCPLDAAERITLAFTFRRAICERNQAKFLADMLRQFDDRYPTWGVNNLATLIAALVTHAADDVAGFSFFQPGIFHNFHQEWKEFDECPDRFHDIERDRDAYCPTCNNDRGLRQTPRLFDLSRDKDKSHFFLFSQCGNLATD